MKKLSVLSALFSLSVLFVSFSLAADVPLAWDPAVGATGYKIELSLDNGATRPQVKDTGQLTAYTWIGAPDTGLLLFRVVACNATLSTTRYWSGAWYDGSKRPPASAAVAGVQ